MRKSRGKPSEPRLDVSTSQALHELIDSLSISRAELAQLAGKRVRWIYDAFGRRDSVSGEVLPILERDASALVSAIKRVKIRYDDRKLLRDFEKIINKIDFDTTKREREKRSVGAVPFLIMDNAIEGVVDALLSYLRHRGCDSLPRKKLIMDFFSRVEEPNTEPQLTYMQACGFQFSLEATKRARKKQIKFEEEPKNSPYDSHIQFARAVALWETLPRKKTRPRRTRVTESLSKSAR